MVTVYTIGHSTHALEEFLAILRAHAIQALIDVRAFPGSRRLPHFNREALELSLPPAGIEYHWAPALGGRRKQQLPPAESPNIALRNPSFRNYADYMLTPPFQEAAGRLLTCAAARPTTIMCAELLFFRCHRMLISDFLALHDHQVLHIAGLAAPRPHQVTNEARLVEGRVLYRGDRLL